MGETRETVPNLDHAKRHAKPSPPGAAADAMPHDCPTAQLPNCPTSNAVMRRDAVDDIASVMYSMTYELVRVVSRWCSNGWSAARASQ